MKKAITLIGMSGVGKTTLSNKLPKNKWFHYSCDYRIASYYLSDVIGDFLKLEAMRSPLIAALLTTDSIYIGSNLSISNLDMVSAYIGKLGNPELGGRLLSEFLKIQELHLNAEISSCYDVGYFKKRAKEIYGYDYFLCDSSGSICEIEIENENVIKYVGEQAKFVYILADDELIDTITQRAIDYPKPLYYNKEFLIKYLNIFKEENLIKDTIEIVPNEFIRFIIPKLIKHRQKRYLEIAEKYGTIINAKDTFAVRAEKDFLDLIEV